MLHRARLAVATSVLAAVFAVPLQADAAQKAPNRPSRSQSSKSIAVPQKQKPAKKVPRRLDGVAVAPGKANLWPVAVMIDNFPTARPQAGLGQASVVYEALAEGGIPRFMAVFAERTMRLVGPVRSTRPYFLHYATEYPAAIVHAGGSPDALQMLRSLHLLNIEGIHGKYAKYLFRTKPWIDVHDLYTTGTLLNKAVQNSKARMLTPKYRHWRFVDDGALEKRPRGKHGATVNLGPGASYTIRYEYRRADNVYLRFTGGQPHVDRNTRKQIAVKNVILLIVPKERVLDSKGRIALETLGKGVGVLLQNGRSLTIRWQKLRGGDRTKFTSLSGAEIPFIRGATWITIVPRKHKYTLF